jgi:16S rRNA (cytosine1402-N4)-methyltransferase
LSVKEGTFLLTQQLVLVLLCFQKLGEERQAAVIARTIVKVRSSKTIETTKELAQAIQSAVPPLKIQSGHSKNYHEFKHPARRTFQALRIFVNDEVEARRMRDLILSALHSH